MATRMDAAILGKFSPFNALKSTNRSALGRNDDDVRETHFLILIKIICGYFTQIRFAEHRQYLLPRINSFLGHFLPLLDNLPLVS